MKRTAAVLAVLTILSLSFYSCKPEPIVYEKDVLNEWIWEGMNEVYLWADDIDQNLYPTEEDPEVFFYQILAPQDRFSWIVDDYQELADQFNNIELSNGISPYFIRISGTDEVIIVVEYVSKGSPADEAGVQRGDIITGIDGSVIDIENYADLFYGNETAVFKFADYVDGAIVPNGMEVTLTPVVIDSNPVIHYEIINWEDTEIGYLVYTHFTEGEGDKWLDSLDHIFSDLESAGITEMIIDLRYNPGGSVYMATHIASVLSPASTLTEDNVFVNFQWNDLLQNYFIREQGENSENLAILFEEDPSNNLDLNSVYFLTTGHTASASELLMIGLAPYMDVIKIGESTYGKCYGSITLEDTETPRRHEWAMQPIVIKYANAAGYTDFLDGIPPDHALDDRIYQAQQFGDVTDPMLAKGLELITGVSPISKKSLALELPYEVLPDPVRDRKSQVIHKRKLTFYP